MLRYDVCSLWRTFLLFCFQNFSSMPHGYHGVHFESSGGPLHVSRAAFLELRGCLGLHFSSFGCVLCCILEALGALGLHFGQIGGLWVSIFPLLGVSWAAFWWPWGFFGLLLGQIGGLWGALGVPMPPPAAQNLIFLNFPLPFWKHFGSFVEAKID